jgi:hypothetical protein
LGQPEVKKVPSVDQRITTSNPSISKIKGNMGDGTRPPKSTSYITHMKLEIRVFLFHHFEPKLKIHEISSTWNAKDKIDHKIIFYNS